MRVAVLSDIHGNLPALEAVLADVAAAGADLTVNLGDIVGGPVDPAGVAALLRARPMPTVRGNHDRGAIAPAASDRVDAWVRAQLTPDDLAWLEGLPPTASTGDLFLCHGTPASDLGPWLDNWVSDRTAVLPDEAAVARHAEGIDCPVLLCGHTHVPRSVRLADGRLVVNPGSVGLQFFYGSPDARYALLERRGDAWSVTFRHVPYDWEGAAALAERNGFPQWRAALVSGWPGPEGLFT